MKAFCTANDAATGDVSQIRERRTHRKSVVVFHRGWLSSREQRGDGSHRPWRRVPQPRLQRRPEERATRERQADGQAGQRARRGRETVAVVAN